MTEQLIVNRNELNNHIRTLMQNKSITTTDGWDPELLQNVLDNGYNVLTEEQKNWLYHNPVALFCLHEEINEEMPLAWMNAIEQDARQLYTERQEFNKYLDQAEAWLKQQKKTKEKSN